MTKKHYEMIAATLATEQPMGDYERAHGPVTRIAKKLAQDFAADNERFDSVRFLLAAGVPHHMLVTL